MRTQIEYRGKFGIKTNSKPTKGTKNQGTDDLFKLLHEILAKGDVIHHPLELKRRLPSYIRIVTQDTGEGGSVSFSSVTLTDVPLTKTTVDSTEALPAFNVEYSGLLTYANIVLPKTSNYKLYAHLLDDSSPSRVLAIATLNEDQIEALQDIATTTHAQATITWNLVVGNCTLQHNNNTGETT